MVGDYSPEFQADWTEGPLGPPLPVDADGKLLVGAHAILTTT